MMEKNQVVPRRSRMDLWTPMEKSIYDAIQQVESAGTDVLLTEAIVHLNNAMRFASNWVDAKRTYVTKKRISEFEESLKTLENSEGISVEEYRLHKAATESTLADLKEELKTLTPNI